MTRTTLVRGMLVGLLAGLLMFGFGKIYGEPQVDRAIAFEKAGAAHEHKHDEETLVSRPTQAGLGLLTGVVVYATAFGGLFALVFAYAYGRVGPSDPRALSALLALGGAVALYIVPMLKYPASPPAVGESDTIALRTALYFAMLAISIAAMVASVVLRQRLLVHWDAWRATLGAVASYVVVVALAALLLPSANEVPDGFPADVLWQFRIASLGLQLVMWTTIGLVFGALTARAFAAERRRDGGLRQPASQTVRRQFPHRQSDAPPNPHKHTIS